ncbi:MAG: hypothetical protein JNK38_18020, partial [Acidobacteria bacterium]|nr:hypothetical protein [Acidobacteriota bacterium]
MRLSRHIPRRVGQFIDSVCSRWLLSPASLPHSATPPGESLEEMMPKITPHEVTQLLLDWRNG